jgi:spermidine/putrescine transport system ATP-binding protein
MLGSSAGNGRVTVGGVELAASQGDVGLAGPVRLTIRPERVEVEPAGAAGANRLGAHVERLVYLGSTTQVLLRLPGGDLLQALVTNAGQPLPYDQGEQVAAHLPAEALRVLAAHDVQALSPAHSSGAGEGRA